MGSVTTWLIDAGPVPVLSAITSVASTLIVCAYRLLRRRQATTFLLQIYVKSGQDAEHMVEAATALAIAVRPDPTSRRALTYRLRRSRRRRIESGASPSQSPSIGNP